MKRYRRILAVSIILMVALLSTGYLCFADFKNRAVSSSQLILPEKENDTFWVYAGGEQIGIYIKTKGILVLQTQEVVREDGTVCFPAKGKLLPGDYILKINHQDVKTKSQFIQALQKNGSREITLVIQRGDKKRCVKITPVREKNRKTYQLGIWLRNNTQGIGTITYIMPGGTYGALGHSITDFELGCSMELEQGSIYQTSISAIQKGKKGTPGELIGNIQYKKENYLGTIEQNTIYGIRGKIINKLSDYQKGKLIQIAKADEIREGDAWIRSSVSGKSENYKVSIKKRHCLMGDKQKSLLIEITDERLLKLTGGIVQGLSGSPIIQNDKLIGAVTHVLVDDASKGYGIMIEDMISIK